MDRLRISSLLIVVLTAVLAVPMSVLADDDADSDDDNGATRTATERCAQGSYYGIDQTGSHIVWSLSAGGTFQGTNSAELNVGFGSQIGNWEIVDDDPVAARATYLNFIFDPGAFPPVLIGRVDISMEFDPSCETIHGTVELRLYDEADDPLDPSAGILINDDGTFQGRRIR